MLVRLALRTPYIHLSSAHRQAGNRRRDQADRQAIALGASKPRAPIYVERVYVHDVKQARPVLTCCVALTQVTAEQTQCAKTILQAYKESLERYA